MQLQFQVVWDAGIYNLADYPTKHHLASHHKLVRPIYLHVNGKSPRTLYECEQMLETKKPAPRILFVQRKYNRMLAAAAA